VIGPLAVGLLMATLNGPAALGTIWASPVPGNPVVVSGYGIRGRTVRIMHRGLDIEAAYGTPIRSVAEGRVVSAGYTIVNGNFVAVEHSGGTISLYLHLSKVVVGVGAYCWRGRMVGRAGNTGLSTGPHLHLAAMKRDRTYVDPLPLLTY
jgi:murein DD-endopeptidase MepM/ murein hydrolase activator NlpD